MAADRVTDAMVEAAWLSILESGGGRVPTKSGMRAAIEAALCQGFVGVSDGTASDAGHKVLELIEASRRWGWRQSGGGLGCLEMEANVKRIAGELSLALRAEAGAVDYPAEFMASMRKAVDNIDVPKMSPLKQELFKAGCVATINAINLALAQARRADRE